MYVMPAPHVIHAYVQAVSDCLARDGDHRFLDAEVMRGLTEFLMLLAEIRISALHRAAPIDTPCEYG
jgi:hypothetical protein